MSGKDSYYYMDRKDQLIDSFSAFMKGHFLPVLQEYADVNSEEIYPDLEEEILKLGPEIPYIGGDSNYFTRFMVGSAMVLAAYKVVERRNLDVTHDEFGEIVFRAYTTHFEEEIPWWKKGFYRFLSISFLGRWYMRRMEKEFRQQKFSHKFEFDYVADDDGLGDNLIYGMRYTQCGIKLWFTQQGYPQLTPFICMLDHVYFSRIGVNLKRTETLAMNGDSCDFMFVKDMDKPEGLPLTDYEDYGNFVKLEMADS